MAMKNKGGPGDSEIAIHYDHHPALPAIVPWIRVDQRAATFLFIKLRGEGVRRDGDVSLTTEIRRSGE